MRIVHALSLHKRLDFELCGLEAKKKKKTPHNGAGKLVSNRIN